MKEQLQKGNTVYYIRRLPKENDIIKCNILQLKIRGVYDTYAVGIESREEYCVLFHLNQIDELVFKEYGLALNQALYLESSLNND